MITIKYPINMYLEFKEILELADKDNTSDNYSTCSNCYV